MLDCVVIGGGLGGMVAARRLQEHEMSCLYVVRCNFSDPTVVADWEHWYGGAKQDWLMSRPGFLAGQSPPR